jgi:tetratricopeptide (TPR) repeat protein
MVSWPEISVARHLFDERLTRYSLDPDAVKLAKRLDGLPLALATAGTYLGQSTSSVGEYLDTYEQHWQNLSHNADELLEYGDRTLFSTWSISLIQIRSQDPEAAEFLTLLAYFDNQDIWYELVRVGAIHGLAWLTALTETKQRFERAMARLHDYSLLEIIGEGYSLHTCIHDWTLQALNHEVSTQYYWLALGCVASHVKKVSERDFWKINHRLVRHAIRLGHPRLAKVSDEGELNEGDLHGLHDLGLLLKGQGKIAEAEQMYQRALAGKEKTLGPGYMSTLDTVSNLGDLYRLQDKMMEAEQMYQRALGGYKNALGPDHTLTLDTVNNLGVLYHHQGKIIEAEQMFQRALTGYEKALGPDHRSTLNTVDNLGVLYRDQGKMIEAEQMYQRALAGWEKALGPDHRSTLKTVDNLGVLYRDQSRMVEAEQMYQRALAGREKALGLDHTATLATVNNLGALYRLQGKMVEAEQMYRRALTGREKVLGPDHISTLNTVDNLGILYHHQGKMMEAEQMYQRALVGGEKALGPDHTSTLNTVNNLGVLYRDQDKMVEAEQMFQRARTARRRLKQSTKPRRPAPPSG